MDTPGNTSLQQTLDDWLAQLPEDDALTRTELHGLVCALATGPEPPPGWPGQLLEATSEPVATALETFRQRLAAVLGAGEPLVLPCRLDPYAEDDGRDLASWCAGFVSGVFFLEPQWFAQDEEGMTRWLLPFMLISGLDDDPELDRLWEDTRLVREMARGLPGLLEELFLHFHAPPAPREDEIQG